DGEMVEDTVRSPPPPEVPPTRPAPPRTIEAGTDDPEQIRRILRELMRSEVSTVRRELHGRYERGRVVFQNADGSVRTTVSTERFFELINRLKNSIEELEEAIVRQDALLPQAPELVGTVRKMQGSLTTFNFLFSDRSDYFSGKY
ncbi:MAG: hypothetical protein AAFV29_24580, partial [Myxococcota bacterium]